MPLTPGEELALRDRTLRILHRPGHSPSDTVFLDGERRIMIGGDHLLGHISSNPVITRPLTGSPYPRPQTLVTYMASMQATAADPVDVVLPGHGEPVHDHRELIRTRLQLHHERRDRLHELIVERPRNAHELARELFADEAISQAALTISEVLGHVDLLLNDGAVVEQPDAEDVVTFVAAESAATPASAPRIMSAPEAFGAVPDRSGERAPVIGGTGPMDRTECTVLLERGFETANLRGGTDEVPLPDQCAESPRVRPAVPDTSARSELKGGINGDRPARRHGHSNRGSEAWETRQHAS